MKPSNPNSIWLKYPELSDRVLALNEQKHSAGQIADICNREMKCGLSRSAVIGYLSRKKIKLGNALATARPKQRKARAEKMPVLALPKFLSDKEPSNDAVRLGLVAKHKPEPYVPRDATCKYLCDTPNGLVACEEQVHAGSYCYKHYILCTANPKRA